MDNIKEEKKRYRKEVKLAKEGYSFFQKKELSKPVWEKLEKEDYFINSNIVLAYWSMSDEVRTHEFILRWYKKKTILLPCVEGDILKLRVFEGMETMRKGEAYSILEPIGKEFADTDKIDLMIIPGIAFDKEYNRLGRGKGYYDKLLSSACSIKVGVCFEFQFFDKIPTEEFDIKMNYILK
ncbi:MAG: 5-formyltetrahydrofolate cyclo-ligase [Bacteroidales bacterium]